MHAPAQRPRNPLGPKRTRVRPSWPSLLCALSVVGLSACGGGGSGNAASAAATTTPNSTLGAAGGTPTVTPPTVTPPVVTPPVVVPPVVTPPAAPVVSTLSCEADLHLDLPSGGVLFNNTWNSVSAGSQAWSQCLQKRTLADGSTQYGWRWSWPASGGALYAYPEVVVGAKPWETGPGNDARFPIQLSAAKTLRLRYGVDTSTSGSHNLATSIWLIRTPTVAAPPVYADIRGEVMIWTDYTDDMVADPGTTTKRGEFTDAAGLQWEVWADENWGDASSSVSNHWTYVAYHLKPAQRRTTADIDVLAILKHAASLGLISTSLYVADVELGNELVSQQGETWITSFGLTVN